MERDPGIAQQIAEVRGESGSLIRAEAVDHFSHAKINFQGFVAQVAPTSQDLCQQPGRPAVVIEPAFVAVVN
jgi:hypothetical protein